jgi:hypothetical protein
LGRRDTGWNPLHEATIPPLPLAACCAAAFDMNSKPDSFLSHSLPDPRSTLMGEKLTACCSEQFVAITTALPTCEVGGVRWRPNTTPEKELYAKYDTSVKILVSLHGVVHQSGRSTSADLLGSLCIIVSSLHSTTLDGASGCAIAKTPSPCGR